MAFRSHKLNILFFVILVASFSVSFCLSNEQTGIIKHDRVRLFHDYTRQRTDNITFPVMSNISLAHSLFLNEGKENKSEGNFQNVGDLLEKSTKEEANEEFAKNERNPELKMQTAQGNGGRNYNGDEYPRNIVHLINIISDILQAEETRNLRDIPTDKIEVKSEEEKSETDSALSGFYTECLLRLSFPCMQRKMLVYVDRLNRNDFHLLGDYLSVVRFGKPPATPLMTEENLVKPRMNTGESIMALDSLLNYSIKRFFYNHAVRVKMPPWFSVGVGNRQQRLPHGSAVSFSISSTGMQEGRGKKGGMKMAATMMKMIMIGKGMMIPVMMGMAKFMGMKGLFMAMMSMVMTKMMLLSKWKENGGLNSNCGGGSGGSGCSGGLMTMMGMGGGD